MARPLLLLIPGMLNDAAVWAAVQPLLPNDHDVIVATLGDADSIAAMAAAALAQMGGRAGAVAGFSMGGYVAQELLQIAPGQVSRLALVDSGAGPAAEAEKVIMAKSAAAAAADFERLFEPMLATSVAPAARDRLAAASVAMWRRIGPQVFARQCAAVAARPDRRQALAAFRGPRLVVCGRGDRVTPPALSEACGALLDTPVQWLDCGHMSPLERPAEVAALLTAWLRA